MRRTLAMLAGGALAASLATAPLGAQEMDFGKEVTARKALMQLYVFNIGQLAGMAKGQLPYDADQARAAAMNLARLAGLDQSRMWPEGSDSLSIEGTRALPDLWDDMADVQAKGQALAQAADALAAVAGDGLDALRAGLGPVGQSCSACHKAYRQPE